MLSATARRGTAQLSPPAKELKTFVAQPSRHIRLTCNSAKHGGKFICAQVGELSRLRDVLHLSEPAVEAVKELRNVPGTFRGELHAHRQPA